ncbi:MAG: RecB-like helicase [Candidatus Marinarcus sp.]|uniref:RecB-like helicase n=1 Tax=Candidatus Marinarcus sp. TaxID=3100987 RepID=UPI003B00C175
MKKYLALKASAGSGKTFALTVRYISLLLLNANPTEILTLTFTNKAANEMSERIYQTLLTLGDDEAYLSAIVEQSGLSRGEIIGAKSKLLKSFSSSELSIYTIDKFVNKILREFCGYIGLNDDFEIKEDNSDDLSLKFLKSLDLRQFDQFVDFFLYENKKFNSLFDLFKDLIQKNESFDAFKINKELIFLQQKEAMIHAFKIKEFVQNCELASKSAISAVDFDDFAALIKKGSTWLTKERAAEFSYFKKCANEILESHFSNLKKELKNYYKLSSSYSLSRLFELYGSFNAFRKEYNKNKNYLEFNDISNLVYDLLLNTIDKDFLYFRLDSRYTHLLIDEFQDTSLLQYKILEPIIQEILSGYGTEFKTFFYVGDTKQSIYRFRGGKRELFDYVAQENGSVEVEALHTNYRSAHNIVEFVNKVFLALSAYEYYEQHSLKKGGYVEVIEDESLLSEEKFETIAEKIAYLLAQGVEANDIAILTYTNSDVLALYTYLSEKFPEVKISTEMTSKLINQENVKAVIHAIKYLYFKEDIYKENCNAILGKAPLSEFLLTVDLQEYTMPQLVKFVATQLNCMDENVIKLLEVSSSYQNILDFIYEIDFLESSIENKEQSGIQILTIFKSKGLEFDTVLLIDRIKRKNHDKSSLLFEYEKVNLKNIYYKVPNLENFDENYAQAVKQERQLALDDELNILYVALTRAKNNLFIFKKREKSVFDVLNLEPMHLGNLTVKEFIHTPQEKTEYVQYTPLYLGKQEKKIAQSKEHQLYSLHSKYFGLATHYCLEMMSDFTLESLQYALSLAKSKYGNALKEEDFKHIQKRITHLLNSAEFTQKIANSNLYKEQALMYKNEIKILDLLLENQNQYVIYDYKTTQDEMQEHIVQVAHYKKAIKEIVKSDEVYGYIIYLKEEGCTFKEV